MSKCFAVLIAAGGSLAPAEIVSSAEGLADVTFLVDAADSAPEAVFLRQVATGLATTVAADFRDFEACLDAMKGLGATTAVTFVDRYCALSAQLNQGAKDPGIIWGRKDAQRQILHAAGLSRIESARVWDEASLRSFVAAAGFPVIVKPIDGSGSRDLWLLRQETDVADLLQTMGTGQRLSFDGMFAEQYVTGATPSAPYLGDYCSAEVFLFGLAEGHEHSFVTDRLRPAWPCRETGLMLPTTLGRSDEQLLSEAGVRAVHALGVTTGAYHVELKPTCLEPEIIEVNGRLGGFIARLARYGAGADLGRVALAAAAGCYGDLEIPWQRCVLVQLFQPPARARRITRAPTRREVARLPGVLAVDELGTPGDAIDWRVGTGGAVAKLWLCGDDHDALWRRLVATTEWLTDSFAFNDSTGSPVVDQSWLESISAITS